MTRRAARRVTVGKVPMGGDAPVSIQSMTNTDTADVEATVSQILRLEAAGCEVIRSSVYNTDCVKAIPKIKEQIHIPFVADIHFDYRLAIGAMEAGVDKLRFNPGNIGEAGRVEQVTACAKAHQVPIRIGVNAGSLEPALLKKYGGPTPEAMVESAMKHVAILEGAGFYDTVISLKASNVPDTVAAYRMIAEQVDYPLHIGVTEAGMGPLAVVKSAMGLGALLLDGIGDTLRVSLTGDPVQEVEAAQAILKAAGLLKEGVEVVSCPTCGRCNIDLAKVVETVKSRLPDTRRYLKVAVMGCAVNGPGEAREADIGVAFGKNNRGVLFQKGELIGSGTVHEIIERLIQTAAQMLEE